MCSMECVDHACMCVPGVCVYRLICTNTVQIKVSYYHCPIDPSILHHRLYVHA